MIRSGVCCGQVGDGAAEVDRAQVVLGQLSHAREPSGTVVIERALLNDHPDDIVLQNQGKLQGDQESSC